ncbi:hypothetical protein GGF31_000190 [Allomyces arbusculus]|nr:hypothetical protein GGF31_000190 [Allomyces arbusculus]
MASTDTIQASHADRPLSSSHDPGARRLNHPAALSRSGNGTLASLASLASRDANWSHAWSAMLRLRMLLYSRNRGYAILGLVFPTAMICIAIGMSAAISSSIPDMGKVGSTTTIPMAAPVAAGFAEPPRANVFVTSASTELSSAMTSLEAGITGVLNGGRRAIHADPLDIAWREVDGTDGLGKYQWDVLARSPPAAVAEAIVKGNPSPDSVNVTVDQTQPISGVMLSRLSSPSAVLTNGDAASLSMSLVINGDQSRTGSVKTKRVPALVLTAIHDTVQMLLPMRPDSAHFETAAASDGLASANTFGSIAQRLFPQINAWMGNQSNQAAAAASLPWLVRLNPSLSTFPVQPSDLIDVSVSIVPPFATYGLYFMTSFFTEQLVTERLDGQFGYLLTNALSPKAYFGTFFMISYLFALLPVLVSLIVLGVWTKWAAHSSVVGLVLLYLVFAAVIVTGSGLLSFMFRSKGAVGPILGFGSAIVTFLPYFIADFALKSAISNHAIILLSIVLPSFGFYQVIFKMAEGYRIGAPLTALGFDNVLLPVILIMLAQSLIAVPLTLLLSDMSTTQRSFVQVLHSWISPEPSLDDEEQLLPSAKPATSAAGSERTTMPARDGPHPNAAIPLDPILLAEKERLAAGRDVADDVLRVEGLGIEFEINTGVPARRWWMFWRKKEDAAPDKKINRVLDDLWFSVKHNECFGYLGANGAGKSTTINILIGQLRPTAGRAYIAGLPVVPFHPGIKRVVGVCPQHDLTFPDLTVREHLEVFAAIKGFEPAVYDQVVRAAMKDMELTPVEHVANKSLSGGNRRRLSIAIACLGRPRCVILDEPTTGVDVAIRRTIWDSLRALKQHTAVVLVTHAMDEADALCDRVGVMVNGSLLTLAPPQRLKSLYGASYQARLRCHSADAANAAADTLVKAFPPGSVVVSQALGRSVQLDLSLESQHADENVTKLPDGRTVLSAEAIEHRNRHTAQFLARVFQVVQANRANWALEEWSIGQTTLAQVFIELAKHQKSHMEEEEQQEEDERAAADLTARGPALSGVSALTVTPLASTDP